MSLHKKYSQTRLPVRGLTASEVAQAGTQTGSATSNGMKIHKHLKIDQRSLFTETSNVSYL